MPQRNQSPLAGLFSLGAPKRSGLSSLFGQSNAAPSLFSLFGQQNSTPSLFSLFGGGKQAGGLSSLLGGASTGSGAGLPGIVANAHKAITTVQKVRPLVEKAKQYGPLIKNMPAMWRMMRTINNLPDADTNADSDTTSRSEGNENRTERPRRFFFGNNRRQTENNRSVFEPAKTTEQQPVELVEKESVPKLFI